MFGREGAGVFLSQNTSSYQNFVTMTESNYGMINNQKLGKSIYQRFAPLPTMQGRMVQTSAWVIHGMPAAINFREDVTGSILEDGSPFLLHTVEGNQRDGTFKFQMTTKQAEIRKRLYGAECDLEIYGINGPNVECEIVDTLERF